MKYCPECGNKLKEKDKFCGSCGLELHGQAVAQASIFQQRQIQMQTDPGKIFGSIILAILIMGLVLGGVYLAVNSSSLGCTVKFEQCKYDCGSGAFGSLCRDMCALDYNSCKG